MFRQTKPRTGLFGPLERVALGQNIFRSLEAGDSKFNHNQLNPELIGLGIQKFAIRYRGDYTNSIASVSDGYHPYDIVGLVDTVNDDQVDSKEELRRDDANQANIQVHVNQRNHRLSR